MNRKRRHSGFTLLEATIAMVLLVIASAGVLLPFAGAANEQAEGARQTTAANLASELMEKIVACDGDWNEPPESAGNYVAGKLDGNLRDAAGQKYTSAAYRGFSRYATCEPVLVASVELKKVTVVVCYDGAEIVRMTTLVGRH